MRLVNTPELLLILPEHLVCRLRIDLFSGSGLSIISPQWRGAASGS
jgi:hypothetical protein